MRFYIIGYWPGLFFNLYKERENASTKNPISLFQINILIMRRPLAFLIALTLWSLGTDAKQVYDSDILTPKADYFTPKSIAFCAQGGGSSHHFWVLEMLKELHGRGHNVSLHTAVNKFLLLFTNAFHLCIRV
jgi:hypothetical protein